MKTVYLVRHAETTWNLEGKVQGSLNIPLSPRGIVQTHQTIAFLSTIPFDAIFTSPLERARAIAEPVANSLHVPAVVLPDLAEIAFGDWEGHTWSELELLHPETFAAWKLKLPEAQPERGESLFHVRLRAQAVQSLLEFCAGNLVLVVAHGGFNRVLVSTLLNLPPSTYDSFEQPNAGISILETFNDGWQMVSMDSTAHLSQASLA
jgi:probable phosphoglycerate mutase